MHTSSRPKRGTSDSWQDDALLAHAPPRLVPPPPPPNLLVHTASQRNRIKANILPTALNKPLRPQHQRLLAQDILAVRQRAPRQRALAPPVQLPQRAVVALHEADIMQVHVIRGLRRRRVALAGGGVVGLRQALRRLEELGARDGVERDGLLEELVEGGVGFWWGR